MRSRIILLVSLLFSSPVLGYELPAELRQRVDRLVAGVEASPTTANNAVERMAVLWEWANEVSVQGGFVPQNLSLVALSILQAPDYRDSADPSFGTDQIAAVDNYVRHLALLDEEPRAFGRVSVEPASVEADTWQTIRVEWRVGRAGVAEGGALMVARGRAGGYGHIQADDPAGENYVSVTSSRKRVRFERAGEAPAWGPSIIASGQEFPVFRVRGGALKRGDTVTVAYGDRSGGSPGFKIGVFSNDAISLPLRVDRGDGSFFALPVATYEVVGVEAFGVHGFAPSIVATDESFNISVRTEDRYYNRATGALPAYEVYLNGERHSELPAGQTIHDLPLRFSQPGVYRVSFRSTDGAITGLANPVWVQEEPSVRLYWGETHGHCGFAEGQGTPEGYFGFARDDAKLDFVTLTEHDLWMTDGEWKYLNEVAAQFHREGELIVYPGYEWSVRRQRGGHHNVFFRRPGFERVPAQEAPDLTRLYRGLRQKHDPADVLIIPHAHQNGDWRLNDFEMERLIEVMSGHGTFEWFGQRYLESGFRVGFVGASDDHRGHPGYSPGHPTSGGQRSGIFQFGGLAAAWASSKSTDAVFDALKARSAYGATGAQRIILDVRLNGSAMGMQLDRSETREIEGRVIGTGPIRSIDLIKNSEVAASFDPGGGETTSQEVVVGFASESYITRPNRDNPRGHRTWRGALRVENGSVVGVRYLGTPHLDSDRLELEDGRVIFDVATRGSRRALALTLEGASSSTRLAFELEASRERGTAPTQIRTPQEFAAASFSLLVPAAGDPANEEVLRAGRYRDRVTVERAVGLRDDVEFHFSDRGEPGDWYYVRVEQLDGHLAWSSPWWVGGEPPR